MISSTRIKALNRKDIQPGKYVFYWMQQSQRAFYNHALEYAISQANGMNQGVLVGFGLVENYPEANLRHYNFMLEGLRETKSALTKRGIKMVVQYGDPPEVAQRLGKSASLIICDRGYLRHQKKWRRQVAKSAQCRVVQVESDVVIPVEVVSNKVEYAARTIRPKIHKHLDDYLIDLKPLPIKKPSHSLRIKGIDLRNIGNVLASLDIDRHVGPVNDLFKGGTSQAKKRFADFIANRLAHYDIHSNQPQTDDISHMSPYLHFGQISPLYLAIKVTKTKGVPGEARASYLEELIVRRELAMNFTHFNPDYDSYRCLPNWAEKTLNEHKNDRRQWVYTRSQLEKAETHDAYWNAAMLEMMSTGFMHNYMRMYWGKKILEWSKTPERAFKTILGINNKYFIDGRDANSYAGVAWIFGVHDRAWAERPIFGKIRYMAASGLERKCDIGAYVQKVQHLAARNTNSI